MVVGYLSSLAQTGSLSEYLPPKNGDIFHAETSATCLTTALSFFDFFFFFLGFAVKLATVP